MSDSLENICRNLLNIDKSIPVSDIVIFLEKNRIYNSNSLFLINFKGIRVISLKSRKVEFYRSHEILGFKKIYGKNEHYYHIYCKVRNGSIILGYKKYISDENLTQKIDSLSYKKIDFGVSIFSDPADNIFFTPKDEKRERAICKSLLWRERQKDFYYFF